MIKCLHYSNLKINILQNLNYLLFMLGTKFFLKSNKKKKSKIICFLPGSRNVEIKKNLSKMMPVIKKSIKNFNNFKFYVLTFDHSKKIVDEMLDGLNIKVLTNFDKKQLVMRKSFLAIAASGSVSLELCKYQVPSIIVYDTHFITKLILKLFVKVNYASLLNIFYNKEVVPEYLFEKFNEENVFNKLSELIKDKKRSLQIKMMKNFSKKMLLNKNNPSEIIARSILN